jgi:hypothetical protein
LSIIFRRALGPAQTPVQWVLEFFPKGKAVRLYDDHSSPLDADVKNVFISVYPSLTYIHSLDRDFGVLYQLRLLVIRITIGTQPQMFKIKRISTLFKTLKC